jgi:sRNA-binding protein
MDPIVTPLMLKLLFALFAGKEVIDLGTDIAGKVGQHKLSKETLALERKKLQVEEKGTERAYKEQRAMAGEAYERAKAEKREDRQMGREDRVFQLTRDSADRQTAMMLSMIQGITGVGQQLKPQVGGIPSIPELLR